MKENKADSYEDLKKDVDLEVTKLLEMGKKVGLELGKKEEQIRVLTELKKEKINDGFEMEKGVMFAEIPPNLLKDMYSFKRGWNESLDRVINIIKNQG